MDRDLRTDAADVLAAVGRHWGWVLTFGIRFVAAFASDDESGTTGVLLALLGVLAGVVVLVYPGISLVTLAVVLGFWLLAFGVMEIVLAFRLRSVGRAAAHVAPAT
jgi:uncharacterized membrane protein HdeD (DUF308 family)